MKKGMIVLALVLSLSGCGAAPLESSAGYQQITAEEAKEMIDMLENLQIMMQL